MAVADESANEAANQKAANQKAAGYSGDSTHGHDHGDDHGHDHGHDHVHLPRAQLEASAVSAQGAPRPGEVVHEALVRLSLRKGLLSRDALRSTVQASLTHKSHAQVSHTSLMHKSHTHKSHTHKSHTHKSHTQVSHTHKLHTPTCCPLAATTPLFPFIPPPQHPPFPPSPPPPPPPRPFFTLQALETAAGELHGARLVARAWVDEGFAARLLSGVFHSPTHSSHISHPILPIYHRHLFLGCS